MVRRRKYVFNQSRILQKDHGQAKFKERIFDKRIAEETPCESSCKCDCARSLTPSFRPGDALDIWMTAQEAADYLRVSVANLRAITSRAQIPVHRLGRRVRYSRNALASSLMSPPLGDSHGS